jgi:hypothetical protein
MLTEAARLSLERHKGREEGYRVPQDKLNGGGVQHKDHNFSVNLTQITIALIGALATVAAAYVAGAFTGKTVGLHAAPTVTVTVTRAPAAAGTGNPASHSSTVTSTVYWHGQVTFPDGTPALNFDTNPPSPDQIGIVYGGSVLEATNNALLSTWTAARTPSASDCREWVSTHPNTNIPSPTGGMQICIKTDQGRYGLLGVTSTANSQLSANGIVWNL